MADMIKRGIVAMLSMRNGEFWIIVANILAQAGAFVVSLVAPEDSELAASMHQLANTLTWLLYYVAGRVISKVVKPSSPTTLEGARRAAGG